MQNVYSGTFLTLTSMIHRLFDLLDSFCQTFIGVLDYADMDRASVDRNGQLAMSKHESTDDKLVIEHPCRPHYHKDERGLLVRCYHGTASLLGNWRFWAGLTMGFPLEHLLWEKVWPFKLLTAWLGL